MRKLAVSTNWPTAAQNPLRKALKGYGTITRQHPISICNAANGTGNRSHVVSSQYAIEELHSADKQQKHHEGVKHHGALRRCGEVLLPYMVGDLVYRGIRG
jgi:hypothetical protein